MNEPIEITKGSTYIFVGKKAMTRNEYSKFKILEVTDTTYLIENIDADRTFRRGIVDFNYDYKPVEVIESYEQKRALPINGVSNRLETACAKTEPLIIEMNKEHLVELYNFAYEQAVKTGKVDELKEIDAKLNGC